MKKLCVLILVGFQLNSYSQNVGINEAGLAPNSSALLDVSSVNKGVLIPRLTLGQRGDISMPATGLLIYQTTDNPGIYYYNGTSWLSLSDNLGNHKATQNIELGSQFISRTGSANVGIQFTANDGFKLRATNSNGILSTLADRFLVDNNGGLVAFGDLGVGIIPKTGAGYRMMWHPSKAAFRAGGVSNTGLMDKIVGKICGNALLY